MTSIAAQTRAAKIAAAEQAADAAARTAGRQVAVAIARPNHPDQPVPVLRRPPSRVSPAAQRKAFLIASSAGGVLAAAGVSLDLEGSNDNDRAMETEAARILTQLAEDVRALKQIQSIERKIERKRELLPNYEAWCAGVLAAGKGRRGPLDEVFTTIMAWRIDVGDFVEVMPMVEHAAVYGLAMPDRFDRGVIAFAVEEIAQAAIAAYDAGGDRAATFPAAVLPQLIDLAELLEADFHDEIAAKLHRALGMAVLAGADPENEQDLRDRRQQTLTSFQRAIALNPRVGVKKQIDQLTKLLGQAPAPENETTGPADAPPVTDTPPEGG